MSDIPEPPVVPPAPSRLNPGTDFTDKADGLAAFYPTLVAYIVAAIAWIVDAMQQIAATALAGTLPSLSGHALKFMRVNAAGTMAEFVAPTEMLAGTALAGLETAHGSASVPMSVNWNFAKGAIEPLNPLFWDRSPITASGITITPFATGFDPVTGRTWAEYSVAGTWATTTSITFGYIFSGGGSVTAGLNGDVWTTSAFLSVKSGTVGTGARVFSNHVGSGSLSGNLVSGATPTLSTQTRTLAADGSVRCGIQVSGTSGQVVSGIVRIEGLQFEKAAARTAGRWQEVPASEAALLLAQPGARLGDVDVEYTAQHPVTSGIPLDSTAPLWTEGAHLISVNYVPKKIGSKLRITATLPFLGVSAAAAAIAVIYVDEVSQRVGSFTPTAASYDGNITVRHVLTVASLSSVKVSLRFGPQTGGFTAFINMSSGGGAATFGGKVSTLLTVEEIAQ